MKLKNLLAKKMATVLNSLRSRRNIEEEAFLSGFEKALELAEAVVDHAYWDGIIQGDIFSLRQEINLLGEEEVDDEDVQK